MNEHSAVYKQGSMKYGGKDTSLDNPLINSSLLYSVAIISNPRRQAVVWWHRHGLGTYAPH